MPTPNVTQLLNDAYFRARMKQMIQEENVPLIRKLEELNVKVGELQKRIAALES